eukprot:129752_1
MDQHNDDNPHAAQNNPMVMKKLISLMILIMVRLHLKIFSAQPGARLCEQKSTCRETNEISGSLIWGKWSIFMLGKWCVWFQIYKKKKKKKEKLIFITENQTTKNHTPGKN